MPRMSKDCPGDNPTLHSFAGATACSHAAFRLEMGRFAQRTQRSQRRLFGPGRSGFFVSHKATKPRKSWLAAARPLFLPSLRSGAACRAKAASRPARHLRAFVALRETNRTGIRGMEPTPLRSLRPLRESHKMRSEEHTSELQSLMRISYAVFCLKKKPHT